MVNSRDRGRLRSTGSRWLGFGSWPIGTPRALAGAGGNASAGGPMHQCERARRRSPRRAASGRAGDAVSGRFARICLPAGRGRRRPASADSHTCSRASRRGSWRRDRRRYRSGSGRSRAVGRRHAAGAGGRPQPDGRAGVQDVTEAAEQEGGEKILERAAFKAPASGHVALGEAERASRGDPAEEITIRHPDDKVRRGVRWAVGATTDFARARGQLKPHARGGE